MGLENGFLMVIGMHLTMHLMHPNLLSDNYYMYVCVYVCASTYSCMHVHVYTCMCSCSNVHGRFVWRGGRVKHTLHVSVPC